MVTVDTKVANIQQFPSRVGNDIRTQVRELLGQVGPGNMTPVAYDTAWVARLREMDFHLGNQALEWLSEHQLPDGSWGAIRPYYHHDRLISTLAAVIAFEHAGKPRRFGLQLQRGLLALERMADNAIRKLKADSNGPTIGFEMIFPTMVAEATSLGLLQNQSIKIFDQFSEQRRNKLSLFGGRKINRYITAAVSAEMVGSDGQHMLDVENLQEANGSVGNSPSATAYYLAYVNPSNKPALKYLRSIATPDGGIPDQMPIDVFEAAWVLWNFSLIDEWDQEIRDLFKPKLDFLKQGWIPGKGIGWSVNYTNPDGDDTAFVYDVLARFETPPDIETVLAFEDKNNFRTYQFESHSSTSTNIHALGALRQAGFSRLSPSVNKIINFLMSTRVMDTYWLDKWHLSPYYTTAHAIIACAGFSDETVRPAVEWILQTQNTDGSWGYQFPSAEETAYCIQALEVWRRYGGKVARPVIKNAAAWLQDNSNPPYPPLWISKGLYTPEVVVRSTILSAILISERG